MKTPFERLTPFPLCAALAIIWVLTLTACSRIKQPVQDGKGHAPVSLDLCLIEPVSLGNEQGFRDKLDHFDGRLYKVRMRHSTASSSEDWEAGDLPECACTPTPPPEGPLPTPPSGGQVTQHFKLNSDQLRQLFQFVAPTPTPSS